MDALTLIVLTLWCGTPNLPMSSTKVNKEIMQCRKALIDCYSVSPSSTTLVNCLKDIPK